MGVFRAMKVLWKGILEFFYQNPNNKVTKQVLPSLVKTLWDQLKDENAVAGFRKSGMFPCSRGMVEDKVTKDPMDLSNPSSGKGYHLARLAAEKKLAQEICDVIKVTVASVHQPASGQAQAVKRRARVQLEPGEVLTDPEAANRIEAEEKAKNDRKLERVEKQKVAAEKREKRQKLALEKAEATAAKKAAKAAQKHVQIQLKRVQSDAHPSQQGAQKGSRTLPDYFDALNKALAECICC